MKIIAVITTKDRCTLFEQAAYSVAKQTRPADRVIVASDSCEKAYSKEGEICSRLGFEAIRCSRTHNYAGSLNSAIYHVLEDTEDIYSFQETYIATLDDDDTWSPEYLAECAGAAKGNEDIVVSGIVYCNENGDRELSIPERLSMDDFLKGNPHIQGSNTFVRLDTLLKAGLFDENMPSTTDRDVFARIFMLNSSYVAVNKHLVRVNAYGDRERITSSAKKAEGLSKFYSKYSSLMTDDVKASFFDRAERLFHIGKEEIAKCDAQHDAEAAAPACTAETAGTTDATDETEATEAMGATEATEPAGSYDGAIVVGIIATRYGLGLRLLRELVSLGRGNMSYVVFANYNNTADEYDALLASSGAVYHILKLKDVREEATALHVVDPDLLPASGPVKDIAAARSILQHYLYVYSNDGDVIWVLDEDMELKKGILDEGGYRIVPADGIDRIICRYRGAYDAVVGSYSNDSPLPMLSTIRVSLLDYVYTNVFKAEPSAGLDGMTDYYYDLAIGSWSHLETPSPCGGSFCLDDVFSGKATSRPLFERAFGPVEARSRGGNTLIFSRELLRIPNCSLTVAGKTGRRSDYFWVLLARERGYKIAQIPEAALHNREPEAFDFQVEADKLLKDFIGASFTHAVEAAAPGADNGRIYEEYKSFFRRRLAAFTASFCRIQGLLQIAGDEKYSASFTWKNLAAFTRECRKCLDRDEVAFSLAELRKELKLHGHAMDKDLYAGKIMEALSLSSLPEYMACGQEGIIFRDDRNVYKYFYETPRNMAFLEGIKDCFGECPQLYGFDIVQADGTVVVRYAYEPSVPYAGGHAYELAELIRFAKGHGFVFDNFKKENFIVSGGKIKLIDYGASFVPYDDETYSKNIRRCYEMLRYSGAGTADFQRIIRLSHEGKADALDYGWELFEKLVSGSCKEDSHDAKVIDIAKSFEPRSVLDYGAGKCRIINILSGSFEASAYDIDAETLTAYAGDGVKVITDHGALEENAYDLIVCNQVLCCVDNDTCQDIMEDIARCLQAGKTAIVSICDPFFNDIGCTQTRESGACRDYRRSERYEKRIRIKGRTRAECHRPVEYYENLFQRHGFETVSSCEGEGVNAGTLQPVAEHLIFVLRLARKPERLEDCSLLIKANPMDADDVYEDIRHIVLTLEKGVRFRERIVTLDLEKTGDRARRYNADNTEKLMSEAERARQNGLADTILCCDDSPPSRKRMSEVYTRYFGQASACGHSVNGQGLYATLCGFEHAAAASKFVFHTDCDILYHTEGYDAFRDLYKAVKDHSYVTACPGIVRKESKPGATGCRTEVRAGFINLEKLHAKLPLHNETDGGKFVHAWHRALDASLKPEESYRFQGTDFVFVHPQNEDKRDRNLISAARSAMEAGRCLDSCPGSCTGFCPDSCPDFCPDFCPDLQSGCVNLQGARQDWLPKTQAGAVVYMRGRNVPNEKVKRALDSIAAQDFKDWFIVYIDDASDTSCGEYARFTLATDPRFKGRSIFVSNGARLGELGNFCIAMQVIQNKEAVVINVDNDDCLLAPDALSAIMDEFEKGADLTCGNLLRLDKPLKRYSVTSFEKVWERDGDNIWLHPKCFKRHLFDCIDIEEDLKADGRFVDVCTDFAMMLPMLEEARHPVFMDKVMYLFDPSPDNSNSTAQYAQGHKEEVRSRLLENARLKHDRKTQGGGGNR